MAAIRKTRSYFSGYFIESLKKQARIYRLDRFVWELAVQKLAQWQKDGRDDLYISVNISTKDFYYMDVYETITSLVETYKIIPSTLKLEIPEIRNYDRDRRGRSVVWVPRMMPVPRRLQGMRLLCDSDDILRESEQESKQGGNGSHGTPAFSPCGNFQ